MADVHIDVDPRVSAPLLMHRIRSEVVPEIEALGLSVSGPEDGIEQRSAPDVAIYVYIVLHIAASAIKNVDDIAEVMRKWLRRTPKKPAHVVQLLGPDGEVLREVKQRED